jgi:hypothetical protein
MRGFKSAVTTRITAIRNFSRQPVWQRNSYEHAIRNEIDLEEIREYIENNPLKWLEDENHPTNIKGSQPQRHDIPRSAEGSYGKSI